MKSNHFASISYERVIQTDTTGWQSLGLVQYAVAGRFRVSVCSQLLAVCQVYRQTAKNVKRITKVIVHSVKILTNYY